MNNPFERQSRLRMAAQTSSSTHIFPEVERHLDNYCFKVMLIVFSKMKSEISHPYGNHLSLATRTNEVA